jgi:REP element-mobilizing transposase RayT
MTAPRRIVRRATYLLSRRCTQREFLLKPSALTNLILKYVLAIAAERYSVLIHAACFMSNHFHLVVTDVLGNLPEFTRILDGIVAKALNSLYGRWENLWAPSSYSAVLLETPEDIIEKVAYTLANPASAGLVEHGRQWPGVWSDPWSIGGRGEWVERPGHYFSASMPDKERLVFSVPPGCGPAEAFRAKVIARVDEFEKAAAAERAANGMTVLGVRRVMKQRHTERPRTYEPHRVLDPRVAARDKWKRIELLQQLVSFLERYHRAWEKFCGGNRKALFPPGTYLMRVRFGVACASS